MLRTWLCGLLLALPGVAVAVEAPTMPQAEPMPAAGDIGESYAEQERGLALGATGLMLGGYAAASLSNNYGERTRFNLDSLSLLLWSEGDGRWSFFGEAELEDTLVVQRGGTTFDEISPVLERLHVDYAVTDAVKFRLGKFLTPIGRWNVLHAAPLTWTTSRPLITEATFPTNATGAMFYGGVPVLGQPLEYSFYASPGEELLADPDLDTFTEAYGAHLSYGLGASAQIGTSYVSFEQEQQPDERKVLFGFDFLWTLGRVELSGEWARRSRNAQTGRGDERGFYVQGVVPITGRLFGVLRYESFQPVDGVDGVHSYLAGLAYRPNASLVLKAEYSEAYENSFDVPQGFRSSLALLF